jgi:DNA replication protein DnaC
MPDAWTPCPKCAEEKREKEASEESLERRKREGGCYSDDFEAMNIRKMYHDATFENFSAYTEGLKENRDAVRRWCGEEGGFLFLLGGYGTGKTHLACAAVRRCRGVIYTMFEITLSLKSAYDGGARTESEVLERLSRARLLAIDEIGRTKRSVWEMNCLSHVINARHENYLPTLFISNGHFSKNCERHGCGDCLDAYLGGNIWSRVSGSGKFLTFDERDYRMIKREEAEKRRLA